MVTVKTKEERSKIRVERFYKSMHNNPTRYIRHLLYKEGREALTLESVLTIYEQQEGKCAITKLPLTFIKVPGLKKVNTNLSIDKINPTEGYTLENIQLVCHHVNIMKNILSMDELKDWCQNILTTKEKKCLQAPDSDAESLHTVTCVEELCENGGHLEQAIPCQAPVNTGEGVETIPKEEVQTEWFGSAQHPSQGMMI